MNGDRNRHSAVCHNHSIMKNIGVLGRRIESPTRYAPEVLCPIARSGQRAALGLNGIPPFTGADYWTGCELSWLSERGKLQIGLLRAAIPCETPNLIGSKSLKLYLNALNMTAFAGVQAVCSCIERDICSALGAQAEVTIIQPHDFMRERIAILSGETLDDLDVGVEDAEPCPEHLTVLPECAAVCETLTCDLLRSLCPVTGQPD